MEADRGGYGQGEPRPTELAVQQRHSTKSERGMRAHWGAADHISGRAKHKDGPRCKMGSVEGHLQHGRRGGPKRESKDVHHSHNALHGGVRSIVSLNCNHGVDQHVVLVSFVAQQRALFAHVARLYI